MTHFFLPKIVSLRVCLLYMICIRWSFLLTFFAHTNNLWNYPSWLIEIPIMLEVQRIGTLIGCSTIVNCFLALQRSKTKLLINYNGCTRTILCCPEWCALSKSCLKRVIQCERTRELFTFARQARAIPNMTISPKTLLIAALNHIYSVFVIANNWAQLALSD